MVGLVVVRPPPSLLETRKKKPRRPLIPARKPRAKAALRPVHLSFGKNFGFEGKCSFDQPGKEKSMRLAKEKRENMHNTVNRHSAQEQATN